MVNTNFKNEILNDEQLNEVAGGNPGTTSADSKVLYEYGLLNDWHNTTATIFHWNSYSKAVDQAWAKAGITSVTVFLGKNEYSINGEKISRDEAVKILQSKFKKVRTVDEGFFRF